MKSMVAVAALVSVTACVSPDSYRRALQANDALQAEMENLTEAQEAFSSALLLFEQQDDDNGVAVCYENLGDTYMKRGELRRGQSAPPCERNHMGIPVCAS